MDGSTPLSKCGDTIFLLSLSLVITVYLFKFEFSVEVILIARLQLVTRVCEIYINKIVPFTSVHKKLSITKKTKVYINLTH